MPRVGREPLLLLIPWLLLLIPWEHVKQALRAWRGCADGTVEGT